MGKQLVNFIICGCESVHPFPNLQSRVRTHAVLVIGLYELLGNPTTYLIEPPVPSLTSDSEMSTADSIKPVLNANLPTEINGQVSLDNPLFNS
jgi:hypothetical protein